MKEVQYDVIGVANYIIQKCQYKQIFLNHLKLQKLCYIAHGYHIASLNEPLFYNLIEVWKYGVTIPDLYYRIGRIGDDPITEYIESEYHVPILINGTDTQCTCKIIDNVISAYGEQYTDLELASLTNCTDSPWAIANKIGLRIIKNEIIKEAYKNIIEDKKIKQTTQIINERISNE